MSGHDNSQSVAYPIDIFLAQSTLIMAVSRPTSKNLVLIAPSRGEKYISLGQPPKGNNKMW